MVTLMKNMGEITKSGDKPQSDYKIKPIDATEEEFLINKKLNQGKTEEVADREIERLRQSQQRLREQKKKPNGQKKPRKFLSFTLLKGLQ